MGFFVIGPCPFPQTPFLNPHERKNQAEKMGQLFLTD